MFRSLAINFYVGLLLQTVSGWTLLPVSSPMGDIIYITDYPTAVILGSTKSACAMQCSFFSSVITGSSDCRCFNYNAVAANCSLFTFEPTTFAVDKTGATRAFQFSDKPIRGLFPTISVSECQLPYTYNNATYYDCRYSYTPTCNNVGQFGCFLPNGTLAFCISKTASTTAAVTTEASTIDQTCCNPNPCVVNGPQYQSCDTSNVLFVQCAVTSVTCWVKQCPGGTFYGQGCP